MGMGSRHSFASFRLRLGTMTPVLGPASFSVPRRRKGAVPAWTGPMVLLDPAGAAALLPLFPFGSRAPQCTQHPHPSRPPPESTGPLHSSSTNGHCARYPQPLGPRGASETPQG